MKLSRVSRLMKLLTTLQSAKGCNCTELADMLGITEIFTLTYQPKFFKKLGFVDIDKRELPHKIWSDCIICVKFPDCDEIAMMKEMESEYESEPASVRNKSD